MITKKIKKKKKKVTKKQPVILGKFGTAENKEVVQNFAKDLYFKCNSAGDRIYNYTQINKQIFEQFHCTLCLPTIMNWARTLRWEEQFIKVKSMGVNKALLEDQERDLVNRLSDEHKMIYNYAKSRYKSCNNMLRAKMSKKNECELFDIDNETGKIISSNELFDDKMPYSSIITVIKDSETTIISMLTSTSSDPMNNIKEVLKSFSEDDVDALCEALGIS